MGLQKQTVSLHFRKIVASTVWCSVFLLWSEVAAWTVNFLYVYIELPYIELGETLSVQYVRVLLRVAQVEMDSAMLICVDQLTTVVSVLQFKKKEPRNMKAWVPVISQAWHFGYVCPPS